MTREDKMNLLRTLVAAAAIVLLALLLNGPATAAEWHTLTWDYPTPGECGGGVPTEATVYIGAPGEVWVPVASVTPPIAEWQYDAVQLPYGLVGMIVVSSNAAGASSTEHGDFFGEGFEPAPCP